MKAPSGFNAMGKPIPTSRLSHALHAVRDMLPGLSTERATALVGRTAEQLERDQPYEAVKVAEEFNLDTTGSLRLVATLLTDPN